MINKLYCMDNLELLKQIPDNYIDLIYCDILYGTGKNFKDYQDLKPDRKIIEEHYRPRITEMYRVLKDTGSIYLQMDYIINHWIRCIMDDIFGYDNFRNEIIWHYRTGNLAKNQFQRKHDNIYFYTKSDKINFNPLEIKEYYSDIYGSDFKPSFEGRKQGKDEKGIYRISMIDDVWDLSAVFTLSKEHLPYNTQKPESLLERIIKASSNEGDIVADFYCGLGTLCVVAKELNRNFIGCDINPKAIEITENRLKELDEKLKINKEINTIF